MPAATTLLEAQELALQNVWGRFLAPVLLRTALEDWRDAGLSELDPSIPEQAEAALWLVPNSFAIQQMPAATGDQNVDHVMLVIETLSRTLERIRDVTLTAGQITNVVAAYNAAFA